MKMIRKILAGCIFLMMMTISSVSVMAEEYENTNGEATYYVMLKSFVEDEVPGYFVETEELALALSELHISGERFCTIVKTLGTDYWKVVLNEDADFTDNQIANALAGIKNYAMEIGTTDSYEITLEYGAVVLIENASGFYYLAESDAQPEMVVLPGEKDKVPKFTVENVTGCTSGEIGDIIQFRLNIDAEAGVNGSICVHNTISKGLELYGDTVVKKDGMDITSGISNWTLNSSDETGNVYQLVIDSSYVDKNNSQVFTVDYSVKIKDTAIDSKQLSSEVYLSVNGKNGSEKAGFVNLYGFKLEKTDKTGKALSGVSFTLMDKNGKYYTEPLGENRFASEYSTVCTDENGMILFAGLKEGSYTLKEVGSADGYSLPLTEIMINIESNGTVTVTGENASVENMEDGFGKDIDGNDVNRYFGTVTIKNEAGISIPSAGDKGALLFYITGGILMVGAGTLLFLRRKNYAK